MGKRNDKIAKALLEAVKIYGETDDVSQLRQWLIKGVDHKLAKYTKKIAELEFTKEKLSSLSDSDLLHELVTNS